MFKVNCSETKTFSTEEDIPVVFHTSNGEIFDNSEKKSNDIYHDFNIFRQCWVTGL